MSSSSSKPASLTPPAFETYVEYKVKNGEISQQGTMPLPPSFRVRATSSGIRLDRGTTEKIDNLTYVAACPNGRVFYGNGSFLKTIRSDGPHYPESIVNDNSSNLCYALLNKDTLLISNHKGQDRCFEPVIELRDAGSPMVVATSSRLKFSPLSYETSQESEFGPEVFSYVFSMTYALPFVTARLLYPNLICAYFAKELILLEIKEKQLRQLTKQASKETAIEYKKDHLFCVAPDDKNENLMVSQVKKSDFNDVLFRALQSTDYPIVLLRIIMDFYLSEEITFDKGLSPSITASGYSMWKLSSSSPAKVLESTSSTSLVMRKK